MGSEVGKDQITVSTSSIGFTAANVPASAVFALCTLSGAGAAARMGSSTNAPTATEGAYLPNGAVFPIIGHENILNTRWIRDTAAGADLTLDARFFSTYDVPFFGGAARIQGLAASDGAEAGNPVMIGGSVDDTTPTSAGEGDVRRARVTPEGNFIVEPYKDNTPLTQTTAGNSIADDTTPTLLATALLYGFNPGGATTWQQLTAKSHKDADSQTNDILGLSVRTYPSLYNGGADATSMDRVRNNVRTAYLASAARTATTNGADRTNYNFKGLAVLLNVTAITATPAALTVAVQAKDDTSGNYQSIATAAAAKSTTGQVMYVLYPTAENAEGWTEHFNQVLGTRTYRVIVTHSIADSVTYSMDVHELIA